MAKKKAYTYQEAISILKSSPLVFEHYKKNGRIKKIERNLYEAKGIDLLAQARNEGITRARVRKHLKISAVQLASLVNLGFLIRIMPNYRLSNFTQKSVEFTKGQLQKTGHI